MALYSFRAYDSSGAKTDGQLEASDKADVIHQLKQRGLIPAEVKEFKQTTAGVMPFGNKVSLTDLEFLTAELSLLLASGVRIDRGIDIIRRTKAKPALAKLLTEMGQSLKKGKSLSETARQYPEVFDGLYCNLIELGEASGNLIEIFDSLAKDLKYRRQLQRKIISSLTYPAVILIVCVLAIVAIFNFIIPQMSSLFSDPEVLPWYTQAMLSASDWMVQYQGWLFAGVVASVAGLISAAKQPVFVKWWQGVSLNLPVLKNAVVTIERIRFNSGLSMMVKAGVPIDQAIGLSAGNINNQLLRREMEIARQKVKRGSALTPALQQTALYPDFFISLLEVGEESGNLERVFDEVANRSRDEFESWTERMTNLLEPLMILFMGGIVGGVVVTMLMSMVSINDVGF